MKTLAQFPPLLGMTTMLIRQHEERSHWPLPVWRTYGKMPPTALWVLNGGLCLWRGHTLTLILLPHALFVQARTHSHVGNGNGNKFQLLFPLLTHTHTHMRYELCQSNRQCCVQCRDSLLCPIIMAAVASRGVRTLSPGRQHHTQIRFNWKTSSLIVFLLLSCPLCLFPPPISSSPPLVFPPTYPAQLCLLALPVLSSPVSASRFKQRAFLCGRVGTSFEQNRAKTWRFLCDLASSFFFGGCCVGRSTKFRLEHKIQASFFCKAEKYHVMSFVVKVQMDKELLCFNDDR